MKNEEAVVDFPQNKTGESRSRARLVQNPVGEAGTVPKTSEEVANPNEGSPIEEVTTKVAGKVNAVLAMLEKAGTAISVGFLNLVLGASSQGNLHHLGLGNVDPISFGSMEALTGAMTLMIVDYMRHNNRGNKISSEKKMGLWAAEVAALLMGLDGLKNVFLTLSASEEDLNLFLQLLLPIILPAIGVFRNEIFGVLDKKKSMATRD